MTRPCLFFLALFVFTAAAQMAPELREDGVLYFDGNVAQKVTATVHTVITVYAHRNFQTALAAFYSGQTLELIGSSPEGYLVKGTYRNNTVTGWIHPEDLPSGIDPGVFEEARKSQARHDAITVAIANKNVIQGMTTDEVKQAVGAPGQVASRDDATGSSLTWFYITYRQEPQYTYALDGLGRPVLQTYYVKVPVGQLSVDFANGSVVSVSRRETNPASPGVTTN